MFLDDHEGEVIKQTAIEGLPKLIKVTGVPIDAPAHRRLPSTSSTLVQGYGPAPLVASAAAFYPVKEAHVSKTSEKSNKAIESNMIGKVDQTTDTRGKHARVQSIETVKSVDTTPEQLKNNGPFGAISRRSSGAEAPPSPADMMKALNTTVTANAGHVAAQTATRIATKLVKDYHTTVKEVATKAANAVAEENTQLIVSKATRSMASQTVKVAENIASRTAEKVASQSAQEVASQTQAIASRTAQNVASQNAQTVAFQTAHAVASRTAEGVATRTAEGVASQTAHAIASLTAKAVAAHIAEEVAAQTAENVGKAVATKTATDIATKLQKASEDALALLEKSQHQQAEVAKQMRSVLSSHGERMKTVEGYCTDMMARLRNIETDMMARVQGLELNMHARVQDLEYDMYGDATQSPVTPANMHPSFQQYPQYPQYHVSSAPAAFPYGGQQQFFYYPEPSAPASDPQGQQRTQQHMHQQPPQRPQQQQPPTQPQQPSQQAQNPTPQQPRPATTNASGTAAQPSTFGTPANAGDDVFAPAPGTIMTPRGAIAMFETKSLQELYSSQNVKTEQFVRLFCVLPPPSRNADRAMSNLLQLGKEHLDSWKMAKTMMERSNWRTLLVTGIVSRSIVASVYDVCFLDQFATPYAQKFATLWNEEQRILADKFVDLLNYPLRFKVANDRVRMAELIQQYPGFQKMLQNHAMSLAHELIEPVKLLIPPHLFPAAVKSLYEAVLEAVRIAARMRKEVKTFYNCFWRYGCRWDINMMVQRTPGLEGQACDEDPPIHVTRCTMAPYIAETVFINEGTATRRRMIIKGEVTLCPRLGNLR